MRSRIQRGAARDEWQATRLIATIKARSSSYTKQDIFMSFWIATIFAAPGGQHALHLNVVAVEEGDYSIVQQMGHCNWDLAIAGASLPFFALNSEWCQSDPRI